MTKNLSKLPQNLPVPEDDGFASHLIGGKLPSVTLQSTFGKWIDLSTIEGWIVVYCYPLTTDQTKAYLKDGW